MYVDTETMVEEGWFTATKTIVEKYKRRSTTVPVPNNFLVFSYIYSDDYELDLNFNEI